MATIPGIAVPGTVVTSGSAVGPGGAQGVQGLQGVSAPVGSITMYGATTPPSGWLLCDGSAYSRSTYGTLFGVIGTGFGAGDGSTTFNVPDMRSRSPLGWGQGAGLTNRNLNDAAGEETHSLIIAELASHGHNITDPGHYHVPNPGSQFFASGTPSPSANLTAGGGQGTYGGSTSTASTSITIQNTGSGTSHNTMHPYRVVCFIIKAT